MIGGKCFAKFALAGAYLEIEVPPESPELLIINMHRGLYQYTRLVLRKYLSFSYKQWIPSHLVSLVLLHT